MAEGGSMRAPPSGSRAALGHQESRDVNKRVQPGAIQIGAFLSNFAGLSIRLGPCEMGPW